MNQSPTDNHLDDSTIAAIAEGSRAGHEAVDHLAACDDCRRRVSAVTHLLADPQISGELLAADSGGVRAARKRWMLASFGTIAAAAAVLLVVVSTRDEFGASTRRETTQILREGTTAANAAPQILSGASVATGETLTWTSTAQADLYRVRIWNTDGVVVNTTETRDTTLVMPSDLEPGKTYLWEVKARTGWDRWVSSDFMQLVVTPSKH